MPRFFNIGGPCNPADHYMLSPLGRLPKLRSTIDRKQYFVVHAPRQTGKTTALQALAARLSEEGRYAAVLVTAELGATGRGGVLDVGAAEAAMLGEWALAAADLPAELRPPPWPAAEPMQRIHAALTAWAEHCPRPLVVFIDEIDALRDDVLISVLRQLRAGHRRRPKHFPWSLALVGLRDVRDYELDDDEQGRIGTSSPFNIKEESLTLAYFSRDEVAELYAQHTEETGRRFEPEAVTRAYELSGGQPWLVNALAYHVVEAQEAEGRDVVVAVDVDRAARLIIERQDTHLDSLSARLREPRIRALVEPMLAGGALGDVPRDDQRFAVDLGLLRLSEEGGLEVANPIYREVIVRELASGPRAALPRIRASWLDAEGRLVPDALCDAFLAFWRQHGDAMLGSAPYHEVAPQLVLMAFLHRVVNGGGSIEREYAIGRGRIDLCLRMGDVTLAMELKVWRDGGNPRKKGLAQLDGYLEGLGLGAGWLVIFDRRTDAEDVATRTRRETAVSPGGREITVVFG